MEIKLDPEADALYLTLKRGRVAKSREIESGVMLDLDRQGCVLGVEMLDATRRYATATLRQLTIRGVPHTRRPRTHATNDPTGH